MTDLKAFLKKYGPDMATSTALLNGQVRTIICMQLNNIMLMYVSWFQDSEVHAEAQKVLSGNANDDNAIIIKNLVKVVRVTLGHREVLGTLG